MTPKIVPYTELTYSEYRALVCSFCDVPKIECAGKKNSDIDACADPANYF